MSEACNNDPMVLSEDTAFFTAKLSKEAAPIEEEKAIEEKPKRNRKQSATERTNEDSSVVAETVSNKSK